MYTAGQEAKASEAKLLHYSSAQHSTVQYSTVNRCKRSETEQRMRAELDALENLGHFVL
jgi:hypothetical protein